MWIDGLKSPFLNQLLDRGLEGPRNINCADSNASKASCTECKKKILRLFMRKQNPHDHFCEKLHLNMHMDESIRILKNWSV